MRFDLDELQSLLRTETFGRTVFHYDSCGSTMDEARREAQAGAPEGAIALAEEQTAGRGRLSRTWVSPPGANIYVTVIARPTREELRYLALIAPLSVSLAIEETTGLFPRVKWPNDVTIGGRKVSGTLIESSFADDNLEFALVGTGVNVSLDAAAYAEIRDIATSLRSELNREVSRDAVLAAMLNRFESLWQAVRRGEVVSADWKQRLDTLGKEVRISSPGSADAIEGVAIDADSDGALIVRRDDGSHVRVETGEATLRE